MTFVFPQLNPAPIQGRIDVVEDLNGKILTEAPTEESVAFSKEMWSL